MTTVNKGKLVIVEVRPGQYAKMYESDAIKKGLLYEKECKGQKAITPTLKKDPILESVTKPAIKPVTKPDDFTEIPGIGKTTAGELYNRGYLTFDQLLKARYFSFLNCRAQKAVTDWIEQLENKNEID
jgi:predicted flap endonuclease-1-like 5' DNA nuclease